MLALKYYTFAGATLKGTMRASADMLLGREIRAIKEKISFTQRRLVIVPLLNA